VATTAGKAERVNAQGSKDIVSGYQICTVIITHQEPSNDPQVTMMQNFFTPKSLASIPPPTPTQPHLANQPLSIFELVDFPSDEECEEYEDNEDEPSDADVKGSVVTISEATQSSLSESVQTNRGNWRFQFGCRGFGNRRRIKRSCRWVWMGYVLCVTC
jgi:hypothetical protein